MNATAATGGSTAVPSLRRGLAGIETRRKASNFINERAGDFFLTDLKNYNQVHHPDGFAYRMSVRLDRHLEIGDAFEHPRAAGAAEGGFGLGYLFRKMAAREFRLAAINTSRGMLDVAT